MFVACGGTESLDQFKALYWWEWLRQASLLALAGAVAIGLAAALLRYRFALRWFVAPSLVVLGYFLADASFEFAASNVDTLIRYNVGQYRHALGMTFASLAIALTLSTGLRPTSLRVSRGLACTGVVLGGARCRDRGAVCGTQRCGGVAELSRLRRRLCCRRSTGSADIRRSGSNLTFNPYAIQLEHRLLALLLWIVLLAALVIAVQRKSSAGRAIAVLFVIVTAQMASGIATLVLGMPALPALVHGIGGVAVLAGFFYLLSRWGRDLTRPVTSNCH